MRRLIIISFILLLCTTFGCAQEFERLKGYYRIWQTTDSTLTYFWDGYMEIYVPTESPLKASDSFCERKFLGERRRKSPDANGDDLFIRINLPNLEVSPLSESVSGDEYSTRNNGDIYLLKFKAGHIEHSDSTETITVDELAGRPDHRLDMSQLKMYGIVAAMTGYDDSETRLVPSLRLLSFSKHTQYKAHYKGEDTDEDISVTSEFFVTSRQFVTKQELKKIRKEKNRIWNFSIPNAVPALPQGIASDWTRLVEY